MDCGIKFLDVLADPPGVLRLRGQQGQTCEPVFTCLLKVAMGFPHAGVGGILLYLIGVEQAFALSALQRSRRECAAAARTSLAYIGSK